MTATPLTTAVAAPPQLWYEIDGERYAGRDPTFYAPEDFPWVKTLEDNWRVIRDEVETLFRRDASRLNPYFVDLAFPPKQWKTMGFYFWKYRLHANCRACPRTAQILESIPNMTAGSVSVLEAGSNINPHHGDTNAIIRVHLGLSIPAPLPVCGFQVGPDIRRWHEGKALLFCDAHSHSAWNHSAERRVVLIVDVMRPEFADRANAICAHVLATSGLQVLSQRVAALRGMPRRVKFALHAAMRGILRIALAVQSRRSRPLSQATQAV